VLLKTIQQRTVLVEQDSLDGWVASIACHASIQPSHHESHILPRCPDSIGEDGIEHPSQRRLNH
jgi:hypothetical protein